ncbi:MAG: pyridoxamine 5'-phosphate oxidase family protein [Dehalococcoidia bacterium]|nr:pyridoxamine 5'-phosphate oxidase family protein [Dehalococcoidia bacterium]
MKQDLEKAIVSYLDKHRHMALATVKDDGSPYASTVSYVNNGLTIFFMTDPGSQKGKNIQFCPKVGVAVTEDYLDWDKIEGVQLAGSVEWITDQIELKQVQQMFAQKFPQVHKYLAGYGVAIDIIPFLRITASSINYLDYSKGFNHWDTLTL